MPQYNGGAAITSGQNVTVSGNKVLSLTGSTNGAGMSTTGNNAPISTITWASSVATVTTASPNRPSERFQCECSNFQCCSSWVQWIFLCGNRRNCDRGLDIYVPPFGQSGDGNNAWTIFRIMRAGNPLQQHFICDCNYRPKQW